MRLQSLYDLAQDGQSSTFINNAGDEYIVYITNYSLMDPEGNGDDYIQIHMIGFERKQANPQKRSIYDSKTRKTIIAVFEEFIKQNPDSAFVYVCSNSDNLARNRRVTFGRWFNEESFGIVYDRYHSSIKYNNNPFYSSLIVKNDNPVKDRFLKAFRHTIKQILTGTDAEVMERP